MFGADRTTVRGGLFVRRADLTAGRSQQSDERRSEPHDRGLAAIVAELLDALQLEDVVPVGNHTGGAITHIVATAHPRDSGARADHLRRLRALPAADPQALSPPRSSGRHATAARQPLRTRIGRKRGSGALAHADIDARADNQAIREEARHRRIELVRSATSARLLRCRVGACARLRANARTRDSRWRSRTRPSDPRRNSPHLECGSMVASLRSRRRSDS